MFLILSVAGPLPELALTCVSSAKGVGGISFMYSGNPSA